MRSHLFAVGLSIVLLAGLAYGQARAQRPLSREGLVTARMPRQYQPPSPTATPTELEQLGDEYRSQKAYADSVDYYRAALVKTSDKLPQAELYNKIGIAELQMQHFTEALKNFQRAIKCNKSLAEAYNNSGATLYIQKRYGRAIKEYKKALELRELDASFHANLGAAYFSRNDMALAIAEYKRALELDTEVLERTSRTGVAAMIWAPENRAHFDYLMAKMYAQAGDFERSLRCLRKAMEAGYKDIKNVYKDQEFAALRDDARFSNLMAGKPIPLPE
jgi:tetratricopeptide (TPR) repeat protein